MLVGAGGMYLVTVGCIVDVNVSTTDPETVEVPMKVVTVAIFVTVSVTVNVGFPLAEETVGETELGGVLDDGETELDDGVSDAGLTVGLELESEGEAVVHLPSTISLSNAPSCLATHRLLY